MFSAKVIKVDTYGFGAKSSTSWFENHVNTPFNKIPQLAMELQGERDRGMIPQGIGWGVSQIPWAIMVWPDVNRETHEPLATFFSSVLNHQFLVEVG